MNGTSMIIPSYNGLHLLKPCIESIRLHTHEPYEIIVVDNGSTDGTAEYCIDEKIILVSLPRNEGFPAACNKGLAVAGGEQLMLLNNDCLAGPGWLSNLLAALYSAQDIGMVGPVTNYASGPQQVHADYKGREEYYDYAAANNLSDPGRWTEVKRLVGLCLLFKRSTFKAVGYLDERFSPGHFEDDDYCYRIRAHGLRLLMCADTFIHHEGSSSFKTAYPDGWLHLVERGRRLFHEKWGIDPHQFISGGAFTEGEGHP